MKEYHTLWNMRKEERARRKAENPNIFQGILFCAHCGKGMSVRKRQFGNSRMYQHFCCVNPQCKNHVNIAERLLQILIMDEIRRKECTHESSVPKIDVLSLQRQIAECKNKKRILYEQLNDGKIDKAKYLAEKDLLSQTEQDLEQKISENSNRETVTVEKELHFSAELLSQLVMRIDVISEQEITITYKSEVSK